MIINADPKFVKHYKKRILSNAKLDSQFQNRLKLLAENPTHPLLRLHRLSGKLCGFFSFSVTGDIRVLFEEISENEILLRDIGSHNQVY